MRSKHKTKPWSGEGWLVPFSLIAAAALAVEIPFWFHHGVPSGHDAEFHLYSWLEVLGQWRQGIVYPRWAALAQYGYGEPRFIFYPPASWMLGAGLGAILPGVLAPAAYIWLALVAAGSAMFALARRWMEPGGALFAAILYTVNPYHLVIVYWRSALAELLASCLLPLLLISVLRAREKRRYAIPGMAAVLATGWLVNAPAAVMMQYSFALIVVTAAWVWREPRLLYKGALAVALGAALAAFYLVPAALEQHWINVEELTNQGYGARDNFLFAHTPDAEHDAFLKLVSVVACVEIGVALLAIGMARNFRRDEKQVSWMVGVWAAAASLLMLPVSAWVWAIAPEMRFMQFPWRWLLPLGLAMALFVAQGMRRWPARAVVCAALLGVVVFAWERMQAPWWDAPADLQEMRDNMEAGAGYEGADEYRPLSADASAIDKDARSVTLNGAGQAAIHVQRWGAEDKEFTVEMRESGQVALRLFQFPAWRVEVNGLAATTGAREDTGQMLVPLGAGISHVRVRFARTWDRTLGGWASVGALLILILMYIRERWGSMLRDQKR